MKIGSITFKNGSIIKIIPSETEVIRGHRSELPMLYDNDWIDMNMVNEVLKPFKAEVKERDNCNNIIYISSKGI